MVTLREFYKAKQEKPESRIGQRTWKQESYRNKLYRTLKKGLKKSDADAIVNKENFDKEKNTLEYISAKYGTTNKGAIQMVKNGYGELVADNIDKFSGLDKEFAILMVEKGYLELVADNIDKFSGLDKEFAMSVLNFYKGHGYTVYGRDYQKGIDGSNAIRKLCELIVKNADKISGLDKEFFDLYLDFNIKLYDDVTCGYGMRYATRTKWNSTEPLLDSIEFIEGVDEKLLLDHCLNLIKSYESKYECRRFSEGDPEGDRAGDSYRRVRDICESLVKKATIKIPETVWNKVSVFGCFDESNLDFSTFYDRLEGFNFNDYFKARLSGHEASSYYINKMQRNITIDDFEKLLIVGHYTTGIGFYLKTPSYGAADWEKWYALVVKYLDYTEMLICFENNNDRKGCENLKKWFDELQAMRKEKEEKEQIKKSKEAKKLREREKNLKRLEIGENIGKNYSYGIKLFFGLKRQEKSIKEEHGFKRLGESDYVDVDYVKQLLLKTRVNGPVSKTDFTRLYGELAPEEQKKLLRLFKKVKLD